ncbi:MAG: Glu-tRNA(Gln) amidotransferase GatDE subunit E [Candidatus Heimdallarchaeota archaeon]|nr:Glu-tRNA(Gln) amidotransferase GatDE subunit E [Candidatus Heimdallarchaeota archaeon]
MAQVAKKQDIDYQSLGLKCGLEIHQQLDTGRKLFCHCKADLRQDNPMSRITRHMRPTLSEMGDYDKAALMEFKKQRVITYEIYDSICTYEIDETPPFDIDTDALDLALSIARLFQMEIIDESHINRKQYLDGSIPTGFQRTMIIGTGGKIKAANKTINLDILALEEDSCREITNIGRNIIWRVDRLGTPLVEIATKTINITEPEEIKSIAEGIGRILRATGKVKRGLGTIRQDLNISIEKGARIEIKGIQILDMLPEYVRLEVSRQLALLEIKNELLKRKVIPDNFTNSYQDCETIFKKSKCKFIIEALKGKEKILGLKLPKMKGLLGWKVQGNRTFGKEIADRVKVITGLGGILHSDELPNYGITQEELDNLHLFFDCKATDAVTIVIGKNEDAIQAIEEIIIRVKEALLGVPEETRHALDDGTTSFRRYLGGASRMYPDTDTYPIVISENRIKRIEENLPELPDKKEERYIQEFNLPEEIAKNLAISSRAILFDELVKSGIDPILAAVTLEQTIKALAREETPVENLTDKRMKEIFELLLQKKIAKEALEPLLKYFCENPKDKIESAMKKLNLEVLSENELIEIIDKIINNNLDLIKESSNRAKSVLMGQVMAEVRGKIDGQLVNATVEKRFNIKLKELGKE